MKLSIALMIGAACSLGAGGLACAQDPAQASPATHKVILDNDKVRVLDIHVPAAARVPMHRHATGYVAVAMTDCKMKFTLAGGQTRETTLHAGDVIWDDPVSHAGTNECHVLNVEPKAAKKAT